MDDQSIYQENNNNQEILTQNSTQELNDVAAEILNNNNNSNNNNNAQNEIDFGRLQNSIFKNVDNSKSINQIADFGEDISYEMYDDNETTQNQTNNFIYNNSVLPDEEDHTAIYIDPLNNNSNFLRNIINEQLQDQMIINRSVQNSVWCEQTMLPSKELQSRILQKFKDGNTIDQIARTYRIRYDLVLILKGMFMQKGLLTVETVRANCQMHRSARRKLTIATNQDNLRFRSQNNNENLSADAGGITGALQDENTVPSA